MIYRDGNFPGSPTTWMIDDHASIMEDQLIDQIDSRSYLILFDPLTDKIISESFGRNSSSTFTTMPKDVSIERSSRFFQSH